MEISNQDTASDTNLNNTWMKTIVHILLGGGADIKVQKVITRGELCEVEIEDKYFILPESETIYRACQEKKEAAL